MRVSAFFCPITSLVGHFFSPRAGDWPDAAAWFLVLLGLSACTSHPPPAPKLNLAGFPPAFREGYAAGCESATSLLEHKDGKRYKEDRQYAAGWNDGLSVCRRQAGKKSP